jgi:hypothetical protein
LLHELFGLFNESTMFAIACIKLHALSLLLLLHHGHAFIFLIIVLLLLVLSGVSLRFILSDSA